MTRTTPSSVVSGASSDGEADYGASASPTGAFVPDGIEPASGLDQRLQSPSGDELGKRCADAIMPELFEPAIKKVADELYCTLMESVQNWLCENAEQNIASRIDNAERWARELRKELYDLDVVLGIRDRFIPRAQRVDDLLRAEREREQLLYAVASKHEGETRYETAVRYIREREERCNAPAQGGAA